MLFDKLESGHRKGDAVALHQQLKPFEGEVYGELSDYLRRTVNALRWKMGYMEGPVDPLTFVGYAYSFDGRAWTGTILPPESISMSYGLSYCLKAPATICEEVVELVAKKTEEPLGHQLFREAWSLRAVSRRSALVIGFSAGGVGFKQFIAQKGLPLPSERIPWYTAVMKLLSDQRLPRPMISGKPLAPPKG